MTAVVWDKVFEIVIGVEGGYQCLINDRGNWTSGKIGVGELKGTKYGICAMSYPHLDIENLSLEEAKQIYKKDYWDKCKCDYLPNALSLAVFDYAVNSGIKQAIKDLQRSLGVTVDGIIGNQTIGAANTKPLKEIYQDYLFRRLNFMITHCDWQTNGKGWGKRINTINLKCEELL